ncbi:MAG: hypothetical protein AAGF99_00285 [Bacteroidota bacterium]
MRLALDASDAQAEADLQAAAEIGESPYEPGYGVSEADGDVPFDRVQAAFGQLVVLGDELKAEFREKAKAVTSSSTPLPTPSFNQTTHA